MIRHKRSHSRSRIPAAVTLLIAMALLLPSPPAWTDDRDLLSFNSAKPFLFILMDTSGSMNFQIGPGEVPLPGGADHPESRLYAAKQALFEVFEGVDDVHFGFATFNQDETYVKSKHWLYYIKDEVGDNPVKDPNWPISYPVADPDGLTMLIDTETIDTDGDGIPDATDGIPDTPVGDIEGDALTYGTFFDFTPTGEGGSCDAPLPVGVLGSEERNRLNAFPRLGGINGVSSIWIEEGGTTYRLDHINNVGDGPGSPSFHMRLELNEVASCSPVSLGKKWQWGINLFLDPVLNEYLMIDGTAGLAPDLIAGDKTDEPAAGLWDWQDAEHRASCGGGHPFTGQGWEGNYDSGAVSGDPALDLQITDVDKFCPNPADPFCVDIKPIEQTQFSAAFGRTLDRGDMLPFNWQASEKTAFLQRLAPNYQRIAGPPDYRVSSYFEDWPDNKGLLQLRNPAIKPLLAIGPTPLGKTILDTRCWYVGTEGAGGVQKCRDAPFFGEGWFETACTYDPEYGCRRVFFILVSDGDDNCAGENPTADIASLNSHSGIRTWAINLGAVESCQENKGELWSITKAGKGECITASTKEDLTQVLSELLGEIREEVTAFASAAVPTIRADVEQSVVVSSFVPINGKPIWNGHMDAFTKPLPLTPEGRPDTDHVNHIWDVAEVLVDTQYDAADPLGNEESKRRVYYAQDAAAGDWPNGRRLLDPTVDGMDEAIRYDLWRAFQLTDQPDDSLDDATETALQDEANAAIAETFRLKTATLIQTGEVIEYLLGDVFHSDPLIVGAPINPQYFALDAGADQDRNCEADDSGGNTNRGYRCFEKRQSNRRKVMFVGTNDAMLHAVDTGRFDSGTDAFDEGSGKEVFAYMPRSVMPTAKALTEFNARHSFSVDGPPVAADVFIDPLFDAGGPVEADRLWRTVLLGGLREGGAGIYALDLTSPEPLTETVDPAGFQDFEPQGGGASVPACITTGGGGCGPIPYASPLWEFTDSTENSYLSVYPVPASRMDEDENGQVDLADTWSVPQIGRLRICEGSECDPTVTPNDITEKYVAIFGGGICGRSGAGKCEESLLQNGGADLVRRGNWVYIVDIETGRIIYKRQVLGAVASEVAAIDTDQDSFIDRLYVATTWGYIYRIDLGLDSLGEMPGLEDESVKAIDLITYTAQRVTASEWDPRMIFDANHDGATDLIPGQRPFFQRPSVFLVSELGLYGLALGSGDREDLWSTLDIDGRFFVFVDDTDQIAAGSLPLDESSFVEVLATDADLVGNLLLTRTLGEKGWYLVLEPDERVNQDAFSLSGITVFTTFLPQVAIEDANGDPIDAEGSCSSKKFHQDTDNRCAKTGTSRIYVVNTTNANQFLSDELSNPTRFLEVSSFVTEPFTEVGQNKNDPGNGGEGDDADDLTESEIDVMNALKDLFPANCQFANYRIDIKTISSTTELQRIATVPICLITRNWKEF